MSGLGAPLFTATPSPARPKSTRGADHHVVLDQRVDDRRIADDDIEALAGFDLLLDLGIHPEAQIDLVAGRAFELRAQLAHRGPGTIAAQHLEFGGLRGRSRDQQRGGQDADEWCA